MNESRHIWLDRAAGPVVRPYAVTRGRTATASGSHIGLIDLVLAVDRARLPADARLNHEHRRLLNHCRRPITVVDLASDLDLPVGVIRVLLGDLSECGAVRVVDTPAAPASNERLLRDVLDALQGL